jgi:phosphomannomutase
MGIYGSLRMGASPRCSVALTPNTPRILREYDTRGIIGTTLFAAPTQRRSAARLPRCSPKAAGPSVRCRIAVGYDGRLTSPELEAALVKGLVAGGSDVERIGRGRRRCSISRRRRSVSMAALW